MWLSDRVIAEVDDVAHIRYIGWELTKKWNANRKAGELVALTGWTWTAKDSTGRSAQRIKTKTACYVDAAEQLLGYKGVAIPQQQRRPRLRLVAARRAA